jgi:HAMP domain-containing protein
MKARTYKRRQYMVDPDFQYGFIKKTAIFCILMVLMSLFFLCLIYIMYGDIQFYLFQPDPYDFSGGVDTLSGQRTLLDVIWPVLGVCLGTTLVAAFFFGLLISHRMAGAIFRIRGTLGEMATGDFRGEIRLRKRDDFKSLAESVNLLKKSWRGSLEAMRQICVALESADAAAKNEQVKKLREILNLFQY